MLPKFIHTIVIGERQLICHYHPIPNEQSYVVQILNDHRYNSHFKMQLDNGHWTICGDAPVQYIDASASFEAPILDRIRDREEIARMA